MGAFDDLPDASQGSGAFADIPPAKKKRFEGEPIAAALEPLLSMATGAVAKPASDIAGLASIPLHALGITQTDPTEVKNIVQQGMTYEPRTELGKSEANPLNFIPQAIGKGVNWAATGLGKQAAKLIPDTSPNLQAGVQHSVTEAVNEAPMFIGAGGPATGAATQGALKGGAQRLMQSALKPTEEALRTGKAATAIDTLLNEGYNVTKGGAEKMTTRLESLDNMLGEAIKGSDATVSKDAVVSRLWPEYQRAVKDANPNASLEAISKSWDEYVNHPLLADRTEIPVQLAQEMKRATNKAIQDAAYGAPILPQTTRNKKALVRGMREEIAAAVPEVGPINAEMSPLINARDMVERRAAMDANKNPLGIGLVGSLTHLPLWLLDRSALPKSLLARLLNTMGEAAPAAGEAALPAGMVMSQQANEAQRRKRLAELLGSQ